MKKTMYIPKGKEICFESLTCENIIVNGSLKVDGEIRARHISGKGFVYANVITAKYITADIIDAGTIITDRLIAARVAAVEIHAVESAAISSYVEADLVKAGKITFIDAVIADLVADEIVQLKPKRRGLLGTLLASFIRASWTALFYKEPREASSKTEIAEPAATPAEATELETLLNDPEFMRIRSMYQLTREMDLTWQLVPREKPAAQPVAMFSAALSDEKIAA